MQFTGELTIVTCWCGIKHAVPSDLRSFQLRRRDEGEKYWVYCPLGHTYAPAGESKAEQLEKQLARERASHDQTAAALRQQRDLRKSAEYRERAQKAAKTRIKNRVKNGVCPCCNRTFQNLLQHMKNQHPEWASDEAASQQAETK